MTGAENESTPRQQGETAQIPFLGEVLRRYEFGKVDFGQLLERPGWFQIDDEGGVGQSKLLKCQGGMADAVDAGIATVLVVILLNRTAGAVIRGEKF